MARDPKREPEGSKKGGRFAVDVKQSAGDVDLMDAGPTDSGPTDTFTCAGTTSDGNPCLNWVDEEGETCGLCAGTATDNFGNVLGRGGFPRDGRGSAKVTSPDGELYKSGKNKGTIKFLPYKSASSIVVSVSETGLTNWKQDQLMRAFVKDDDFTKRFKADMKLVEEGKLDERATMSAYRNEAHEIAESQRAAQRGTFAHWLTECKDNGESPIGGLGKGEALGIDSATADEIMAGWIKVNDDHGFESVAVETKIVNDEFRAAGTTDRVVRLTKPLNFTHNGESVSLPVGTVMISDLKTGKLRTNKAGNALYWQSYSGQLAAYAGGQMYDPASGERQGWDAVGGRPDQKWGVIIHGDLETIAEGKGGGFSAYMVDLEEGRKVAQASNRLREAERTASKGVSPVIPAV